MQNSNGIATMFVLVAALTLLVTAGIVWVHFFAASNRNAVIVIPLAPAPIQVATNIPTPTSTADAAVSQPTPASSSSMISASTSTRGVPKSQTQPNRPVSIAVKPPAISPYSPNNGFMTQLITILGAGFATSTGNTIYFGDMIFADSTSTDGRTLRFMVPIVEAGDYPVEVDNENGTSNEFIFTVKAPGRKFAIIQPKDIVIMRPGTGSASASNTIALSYISGTSTTDFASISLSGLPYEAAAAAISGCVPACSRTNFLTIASGTPEGVTPITVTAKAVDYISTTTFDLIVQPYVQPQFSITDGGNMTVVRSSVRSVTSTIYVSLSPIQGKNQLVALTTSVLPAGVTIKKFPSCAPPCSVTSTLTVSPTATRGSDIINIVGNNGSFSAGSAFSLTIN